MNMPCPRARSVLGFLLVPCPRARPAYNRCRNSLSSSRRPRVPCPRARLPAGASILVAFGYVGQDPRQRADGPSGAKVSGIVR